MRTLTILLIAFMLTSTALAQMGVKDLVKRQLGGEEERKRQLEEAMGGKQQPPQKPEPAPAAIKEGWISRKAKDGKTEVRLFFAYPEALNKSAPAPGLVVIQEWWGLNDDIQDRTRDFARKGFYAVAPDLYHGQSTDDPKQAAELRKKLTNEEAMLRMKTALDLLTEEATSNAVVDPNRIGSIGWCMGGEQSLLLSINDPRVKATAIFYGSLVTDPEQLKKLQGPVLGIFGDDDKKPSPADVEAFRAALKKAGKTDVLILRYTGVGHAFASKAAAKMGMYKEPQAKEAWAKTWDWLNQKLGKR